MTGPWGVVGLAVLAMALWGVVVWLHHRREARVDLLALEAERTQRPVPGATGPELDAAQQAWSRTNIIRPGGRPPAGSSGL